MPIRNILIFLDGELKSLSHRQCEKTSVHHENVCDEVFNLI